MAQGGHRAGLHHGGAQDPASRKMIGTFVLGRRRCTISSMTNPVLSCTRPTTPMTPLSSPRTSAWWLSTPPSRLISAGRSVPTRSAPTFTPVFGGKLDFIRGAARSKRGKPIIALPATAKGGRVSRIGPVPQTGGGRGDHPGRRALRDHRVRCRVPAREEPARKGESAGSMWRRPEFGTSSIRPSQRGSGARRDSAPTNHANDTN